MRFFAFLEHHIGYFETWYWPCPGTPRVRRYLPLLKWGHFLAEFGRNFGNPAPNLKISDTINICSLCWILQALNHFCGLNIEEVRRVSVTYQSFHFGPAWKMADFLATLSEFFYKIKIKKYYISRLPHTCRKYPETLGQI